MNSLLRHRSGLTRRGHQRGRLSLETLEPRRLLAADLVAHWSAEQLSQDVAAGDAWIDSVAGVSAIASGEPGVVTDQPSGRSFVDFQADDGADLFVVHPDLSPLTNANDFSVVVAFRTSATDLTGASDSWFRNTGVVDANQMGFGEDWGLSINAAGQLATGMGAGFGGAPATVYSTATGLNDGQLHIAVVTRSGSDLSLAVDDRTPDHLNDASSVARSNLKLTIGALTNGKLPFTGQIGQVRVYDAALTAEESAAIRAEIGSYYQNEAPQAMDDTYQVNEDTVLFVVPAHEGVLANDTDIDGDTLTAKIVEAPQVGSVSLADDGSFIYSTQRDYAGVDTFTYVARDHRASEPATVTINVLPTYDPPIPASDFYKIRPDETLAMPSFLGVLANDQNLDDVPLTVSLARPVNSGELTLNADGSFVYAPNGFQGVATFAYQIDDGTAVTGPVEAVVVVNTPPVAVADQYVTNEDQPLIANAELGVIANDQDLQSENVLTANLVDGPTHGTLQFSPDGSFQYTPELEYSGPDTFSYRLSDGFESSWVAVVSIEVQTVDDPPVTQGDVYFTLPGKTLSVGSDAGLLANDTDVEGQAVSVRVATPAGQGTVTVEEDGSFSYIPNEGFLGRDTFSYIATDGNSDSILTNVFIDVDSQPLAISEFLAVNAQGSTINSTETIPTRVRETRDSSFPRFDILEDWIELHNLRDSALNLSGLHLTDDPDDLTKWQFPAGTVIPANGYLVVYASGLNILDIHLDKTERLHTNFKLSDEGEYVAVTSLTGQVIDAYESVPAQFANRSYGRLDGVASYFETPTPGTANADARFGRSHEVIVEPAGAFYDDPIQVTLSSPDAAAQIRYSLDGSDPTGETGMDYSGPFTVSSTTTLRAIGVNDSQLPGLVSTHTYLFLDDVILQSPDGAAPSGWPTRPVRGQVFNYGMDPNIVNHDTWGLQLRSALTQVPSISVVLDQEDLTGSRGIYVNASQRGRKWERPASVELLNPDGTDGFQIDIGLRIRGGFSRGGFNPKHSFRLFFRDDYEGPLNYPMFEDEGTDQFRALDLRTAQNYAWSNDTFNDETRNSFLRDIFSRDLQRELGQAYTRGRYYHLYLNGQYWGLYQTEERPEASYAETYFGGDSSDYDVIKASGGQLEATDGDIQPWRDLWAIAKSGFNSLDEYFLIQGKNPDGTDNPDLEVHVQIDNVIDFALNYMFTGNQDMPTSLGNSVANNFWAIRNPDTRDGWQFIAHDSEHNMLSVNDDQTKDDPAGNVVSSFNPKYLHQQLDALPEYRMRFADRIQKHFFDEATISRDNVQQLMQSRVEQIDQAIIAESARWGDQHNEPALDKSTWLAEVDWLINDFLGRRAEIVFRQFQRRNLYPDVDAVKLNQHGGLVDVGFQLNMDSTDGRIYYTLDGQDPREVGGAINPLAQTWNAESVVSLTSDTKVMARVWTGTEWSALTEANFLVGEAIVPTALRVAEVHYHPQDPSETERSAGFDDADDFEFIELYNPSEQPLDLTQAAFVQVETPNGAVGVEFDFANGSITRLGPGERALIVEDLAAFEFRYGNELPVLGQWRGGLSNGGELLTLTVNDQVVQQFAYDDAWQPLTDGGGFSLEVLDPSAPDLSRWNQKDAWRKSALIGGSPGRLSPVLGDSSGDGVFDSVDLIIVFQAGKYEDGIPNNATFAEGDWNGDGDFDSSDLVAAFRSGSYESPPRSQSLVAAIDQLLDGWA